MAIVNHLSQNVIAFCKAGIDFKMQPVIEQVAGGRRCTEPIPWSRCTGASTPLIAGRRAKAKREHHIGQTALPRFISWKIIVAALPALGAMLTRPMTSAALKTPPIQVSVSERPNTTRIRKNFDLLLGAGSTPERPWGGAGVYTAARFARNDSTGAVWTGHLQGEMTMSDVIVEEIRRIRDELIKRYGGIEGYFKHCQAQDRAWTSRANHGSANNRPSEAGMPGSPDSIDRTARK